MADAKYGRLFTEADVRKLAQRLLRDRAMGPDILAEEMAALEEDFTFPVDEPLFLLRGQDRAVSDGVMGAYVDASEAVGASMEHTRRVGRAFGAILAWQLEHPDRVKVPD